MPFYGCILRFTRITKFAVAGVGSEKITGYFPPKLNNLVPEKGLKTA